MQKDPNSKHPGNPGHNEKTKHENEDFQLKGPAYLQQNYRRKLPKPKERHAQEHKRSLQNSKSLDQKRNSSRYIIIRTTNALNKDRILKPVREKGQLTFKGRPIRITPDFSSETMKARRS